jgi:hypothetical protein
MAIEEKDRYEIFQDYLDDLFKKELELQTNNSKETRIKIKELLNSLLKKDPIQNNADDSSSSDLEEDDA